MIAFNHNSEDASVCTSFLIDNDVLMTNRRCIPDDLLRSSLASCKNRIQVVFPETKSRPLEWAHCLEVRSPQFSDLRLDYAFIKLNRTVDRKPITINPDQGVSNLQEVTLWVVNPDEGNALKGTLEKKSCKVVYHNLLNGPFKHRHYPYLSLGGCSLIGG